MVLDNMLFTAPGAFVLTYLEVPQLFGFMTKYSNFSEKAMAPQSNTLAWKIPWMEEPGGLQSMGSLRVVHD